MRDKEKDRPAHQLELVDPWVRVQHLLGHRSPETTRNIYLEPAIEVDIELMLEGDDGIGSREVLARLEANSPRVQGWPA